jgi:hypothetical protein
VVAAAVALLVMGGVGAVKAGFAGADFMYDLELDPHEPALAQIPPQLHDPRTPRLARRVFLVIVDGLRLDKSYQLPFIDELRRSGVDGEATSHYPTWSRPNYVSILTGVPPTASGVRTNHHSTPVALDSLMDRVRAAKLRVGTATDYDVLPRLFLHATSPLAELSQHDRGGQLDDLDNDAMEHPLSAAAVRAPDADFASPFDDARYAPWPGGFSEAGAALAAGDVELVVLLIGAVDAAGHARGAASADYREAAVVADRALARALSRVDLAQDTIIITADHGHTDRGGHGGIEPEVLAVPLVLAGAGVKKGATPADAHLIDIAPTVSALLGIPAPGHGLGRTLDEVLLLDRDQRAARAAADRERVDTNRAVVAAAEARAGADELAVRAQRLVIVGAGVVAAIAFAVVLIRRRVLHLDLRVLLVSVPVFFIMYYTLILTLGQRFSPSLLPAQGNLAWTMAKYGAAAMVVQLAASLWALRYHQTLAERLAAANGVAWTGLMLAMVPAGLLWAFFPSPYVLVPDPLWLVLIPAVQVAVACAAMEIALTLAVEVVFFAARAWQRDRG